MQLLPIVLVAVVMAVDSGVTPLGAQWGLGPVVAAEVALAPVLAIVALASAWVARCGRQLDRGRIPGALIAADRAVRIARWLIVFNHVLAVMVFGWLGAVRSLTGDLVLVDELIAIAPALLGLVATYWAYYPVERRMRDAVLIRRLDEGRPLYPALSRLGYVMLQVRLHVLLLLVPILLIVMLSELIERAANAWFDPALAAGVHSSGALLAAVAVFLLSPLLARWLLDVAPIAPGELRSMLMGVCLRHRVNVRELLLWNTNGSMINAAVMGLIAPLRYVMITDALLELLQEDQVRAVMAHEIGHVRRRHLPWMLVCLLASFVIAWAVIEMPIALLWRAELLNDGRWLGVLQTGGQLAVGLAVFGWVSRRFERQADTFAAQHLSGLGVKPAARPDGGRSPSTAEPDTAPDGRISHQSVDAMCGALQTIARLNTIDPDRPSWRHGSIGSRQRYLWSIIGRPIHGLGIDRAVRAVKLASAVIVLAALSYDGWNALQQLGPVGQTRAGAVGPHAQGLLAASSQEPRP